MARVTVEDCLQTLDVDRFSLTILAAKRARQLANGHQPFVEEDNDKPTVIALREISEGKMNQKILDEIELNSLMENVSETEVGY